MIVKNVYIFLIDISKIISAAKSDKKALTYMKYSVQ